MYLNFVVVIFQKQNLHFLQSDLSELSVKMATFPVSDLLRSKRLLPKKDAKSNVWNFFGFKTDPEDKSKILTRTKVVCAMCETVLSYAGTTSSLRKHLKAKHPRDYCEDRGTPSSTPSTPCSVVGVGPSKSGTRKTPSSQSTTDVSILGGITLCVMSNKFMFLFY